MKRRLAIALGVVLAGYGVAVYVAPLFFSLPAGLSEGPPQGLLFVDREGRPVRQELAGELRAAPPARFEDFPETLVQATLAAEDSRYFSHDGIDSLAILRALRDAAVHGEFVSGASTITQQTIKLYSPRRPRTVPTKIVEALTARRLEMAADKERILTAYLNRLPYGNQFTGARAAARGYFGKPLGDLSAAEAALLAGLPNAPSRLDPWDHFERARRRQHWILKRMRDEGTLDEARFSAALEEPLEFLPGPARTFHAPHFIERVEREEREAIAAAEDGDRRVRTTLDLDLQHFVESAASAELTRLAHRTGESLDLQAAVVVIDNGSGDVLALSGSRSFFGSRGGQLNGAWTPRSPGSALKPFTYLLALERGHTAATILPDTPVEYLTSTGTYRPVNFDRRFRGPVSIRHALANSLNVPAVKMLDRIGGPDPLHETLVDDLRLTGLEDDADRYGLGLTLGNAEVRLLELANAYACLARLGEFRPYRLTDGSNRVESGSQRGSVRRVFDREAAWMIAHILADTRARVEAFGLDSALDLPFRTACKTGTSTDYRDNWTLGYTPDFTVGVWVGRFDNRPLPEITGAIGAAPIFRRVMIRLHRDREPRWYPSPETLVEREVDRLSGELVGAAVDLPAARTRRERFVEGVLPPTATTSDYTADGRTRLPPRYAKWWRGEANDLRGIAALASTASAPADRPAFRIVSPLAGTVAFLDPDLPDGGSRFPLEVDGSGAGRIEWSSPSLEIERTRDECWLILEPGEHVVVARDRRTGHEVRSRLRVEAL